MDVLKIAQLKISGIVKEKGKKMHWNLWDAHVVGQEVCDDGNQGGCTNNCLDINKGFTCFGGNSSSSSIC